MREWWIAVAGIVLAVLAPVSAIVTGFVLGAGLLAARQAVETGRRERKKGQTIVPVREAGQVSST